MSGWCEGPGGISTCKVHVLPVSAWVLQLPQATIRSAGDSKLVLSVVIFLNIYSYIFYVTYFA